MSAKHVLVLGVDFNMTNIAVSWLGNKELTERILTRTLAEFTPISCGLAGELPDVYIVDTDDNISICSVKLPHRSQQRELLLYGYAIVRVLTDLAYSENKIAVAVIENLYGLEKVCSALNYRTLYRGVLGRYSRLIAIQERPPIENIDCREWGLLYKVKRRVGVLMIRPKMTSRLCCRCLLRGRVTNVKPSDNKKIECTTHGALDRDVNASAVIAILGMLSLTGTWKLPPPRAGQTHSGACCQPLPSPPGVSTQHEDERSCIGKEKEGKKGMGEMLTASSRCGLSARGDCTENATLETGKTLKIEQILETYPLSL